MESTKCIDCGYDSVINYKITVKSGEYIYCPCCLEIHAIKGFPFKLQGNKYVKCEITEENYAVKLDDFNKSENGDHFCLSADIFKRLISHNLKPKEHKKLVELHSWITYLLHDDFYDEKHNALQPI